jgi:hypothetical protein
MIETIATLRMVQLILGVLAGFGCLYFGYRLFSQAITEGSTSSGSFKIPGIGNVSLKAAPGIFFAVIGAIIIYVCVAREMSISDESSDKWLRYHQNVSLRLLPKNSLVAFAP